ncbi:hypothetical protein BcepF1.038 [Burkholderia phage BcepF1]|uniref:Uncharacterized protein n=1 Tax=Burkholderia phage BcepF1 TaxID=2886897 RepID=A1YZU2_9CAUD|nr:hypothetical protein BcepF1.038 [Burkholderia phage BcepF1]ABL96769.1 hypothetical protein BcepF1.038 [Burkholderia phage BcepF1]
MKLNEIHIEILRAAKEHIDHRVYICHAIEFGLRDVIYRNGWHKKSEELIDAIQRSLSGSTVAGLIIRSGVSGTAAMRDRGSEEVDSETLTRNDREYGDWVERVSNLARHAWVERMIETGVCA